MYYANVNILHRYQADHSVRHVLEDGKRPVKDRRNVFIVVLGSMEMAKCWVACLVKLVDTVSLENQCLTDAKFVQRDTKILLKMKVNV